MTTTTVKSEFNQNVEASTHWLRRSLDRLYLWAGYAATRYLGISVNGLTSYAGYLMAASTFLGLAHALTRGSHIRIDTIAKLLGPWRRYLDLFAYAVGVAVTCWFAWYACNMAYTSFAIGEMSTDLDATDLWIPQSTMAIGTVLFAICMIDNFLTLLLTGKYLIRASVEAV
jgi:TRAP-type C4-dicarboxylate transport system permease small subunit